MYWMAFAFFAGGQIQVDVRPLATALAQEPFEKELHADRIDGCGLEGIADCRVRVTPTTLNQDIVSLAKLDDVPDDEEISGKA